MTIWYVCVADYATVPTLRSDIARVYSWQSCERILDTLQSANTATNLHYYARYTHK